MIKNVHFFQKWIYLSFVLILFSLKAISQKFKLPDTPKFDSISVDSYHGIVKNKSYFLNGKIVFNIGYNTGSILYAPFTVIGGAKEDSCYAYFNGKNHDEYDFYFMAKGYIINHNYSETSKIFKYKKFTWDNLPLEQGNYYTIKELFEPTISHCKKYKIGQWINYDLEGKSLKIVNYDNFTIDNKPIIYKGKLKIIDSLKIITDKRIIDVYGNRFFKKYVHFNLDQSGYYLYHEPRPEQPGGSSFLEQTEQDIQFLDLSYDIILGKERFNIIQFRVSNKGEFLGKTYFPNFVTKYFYLTKGLDSLNNGNFHYNVINWKKVAKVNGFDITNKDFNVRFDFKPTSDYFGELRFILEQTVNFTSTKTDYTNELKQLVINPWTGVLIEKKEEQEIIMESMEDM